MGTAAAIWVAEGAAITTAGAEAADIIMAGAITDPIFTGNRARHTIAQAESNSR
jgi:hypothetical protein